MYGSRLDQILFYEHKLCIFEGEQQVSAAQKDFLTLLSAAHQICESLILY